MLAAERHSRIVTSVRESGTVSTEDLARLLLVSPETIRRDLVVLEERGMLARVHGGAAVLGTQIVVDEPEFAEREGMSQAAKQRIAVAAASLLRPRQTVVIDVGTTALAVARAIPFEWTGTVATCSMLAAIELAGRKDVEVLVCGGRVRAGDLTLSNHVARRFFEGIHADIAFLGSGGVDAVAGVTDFHLDEIDVRQAVIANARRSWVLADSTKFGLVAQHSVVGFDQVTGLIADAEPDEALRHAITAHGGDVIVA